MQPVQRAFYSKRILNLIRYNVYIPCNELCSFNMTSKAFSKKLLSCNNVYRLDGQFTVKNYLSSNPAPQLLDLPTFEKVSEETLQSLTEYFEIITEDTDVIANADIIYASGVLSVNLGERFGTYVINRQSPNRQIWLSSPTSGPKRYDFVPEGNYWVYKHDGQSLHELLQNEISRIISSVDFSQCVYSKKS